MGWDVSKFQIPDVVKRQVISQVERLERKGYDPHKILEEMQSIAKDPNILSDFGNDLAAAWAYAAERVYVRHLAKKENVVVAKKFIPIGVDCIRVIQKTRVEGSEAAQPIKRSSMLALIQFEGEKAVELKEIVCRGPLAEIVNSVELYKVYQDVVLSDRGYFLEVNQQTTLNSSAISSLDPLDVIRRLGVRKVKMSEMIDNLSRIDESGYVDRLDLRYFEGIVVRNPRRGEKASGSQYGVYDVSDGTVEDTIVAPDGSAIVQTTISVWCSPRFAVFGEESKLGFLGTLQAGRKDRVVFMNAYYVLPLVVTYQV